jgi:hypothetical protein
MSRLRLKFYLSEISPIGSDISVVSSVKAIECEKEFVSV